MGYKHYIVTCGGTACQSNRGVELFDALKAAVKAHGLEMDEGFPIPAWSADAHLKFMDEAGIRKPFFITMQKLFSNELQ